MLVPSEATATGLLKPQSGPDSIFAAHILLRCHPQRLSTLPQRAGKPLYHLEGAQVVRKLRVLGSTYQRWVIGLASLAVSAALAVAAIPAATAATATRATAGPAKIIHASRMVPIHEVGTVNLAAVGKAAAKATTVTGRHAAIFLGKPPLRNAGSQRPSARSLASVAPSAAVNTSIGGNVTGAVGFNGQAAAANENTVGFDVSPPDFGMAVGTSSAGTAIVQSLNLTLQAFEPNGTPLMAPVPANEFFGTGTCTGNSFPGGCPSDPRVLWDPQTKHWFLTDFTFNGNAYNDPSTPDTQYVAVSLTSDALGAYRVFSFTTDTSALNPTGADCPCVGDFDMVGMDNSGFYITTNEFGQTSYHGANVYAFSKSGLISWANSAPNIFPTGFDYGVDTLADPFGAYHLAPSQVTQGSSSPNDEYFAESDANDFSNSALEVYALLGTNSLNSNVAPPLVATNVATEGYSLPPKAVQKAGPIPLGASLGAVLPSPLQTDFDAVQQTVYAGGYLYAQLNTGVTAGGGAANAGVAWFALKPTPGSGSVSVKNAGNGYVQVNGHLLYPSIGVNKSGRGYMAFGLAGANNYPSAAYILFTGQLGAGGPVRIQKAGTTPLDDFTCYPAAAGGCRYGDYSATQVYNGRVYMGTEYVHAEVNVSGGAGSNWATRIWSVPVPA
jgi:hypothetical protein